MRKITRDAVQAFRNNEKFNSGNTQVIPGASLGAALFLHGNCIAVRQEAGQLLVTSSGWETPTTKERLNGLLHAVGCQGIHQHDFTWYWDDGTEFGDGWQEARERS